MKTLGQEVLLSVIIPHAGGKLQLQKLLTSLDAQDCDFDFEVIVICNNSAKEFHWDPKQFHLGWFHSQPGANFARQMGVDHARGEILLFLDDDCILPHRQLLSSHIQFHRQQKQRAGFGGSYQLSALNSCWARTYLQIQTKWLRSGLQPDGSCLHLLGGHFSLPKVVFDQICFDTRLVFGGTETELQRQLLAKGIKLYWNQDLFVIHDGALSLVDFVKKSFKQGIGQAYIDSKYTRPQKYIWHPSRYSSTDISQTGLARVRIYLYRFVFSTGSDFYRRTGQLRVTGSEIFREILKCAPRFLKAFPWYQEIQRLRQLIAIRFIS